MRIVSDSSLDIRPPQDGVDLVVIPFIISFDKSEWKDIDESQIPEYEKQMKATSAFKTACPSPNEWLEAYKGAQGPIYGITISSKLSGSYNAALLGKELYHEMGGEEKVHVFDSKSAGGGPRLIYEKVRQLSEEGLAFEEVVEKVEDFIEKMETMFVSESLDNLSKAGRLSNIKHAVAKVMNIKPVMIADDGLIVPSANVRGSRRAFKKMVDTLVELDVQDKWVSINHSGNEKMANYVKEELEKAGASRIFFQRTGLLNTLYLDLEGVIVSMS